MGDRAVTGYFVGDLQLHELAGHNGEWFSLLEDLTYVEVDARGREVYRYTAESGSLTNFGDIPRPFWWIWPRNGKHSRATVIHDDQCTRRPMASRGVHDLFRRTLVTCGCSWLTVRVFWLGVRWFGPRFEAAS